ncbi:MAG: tripartite tricarboxylate transporter substrate binding protein [Rhodoplanes sp.]|uniref:Bug family tripartite tricarboxylate transporter substrate binding protein n=1 Tax=Rhodoplanes sp. TaxID=1968906 RepID=UPI0017E7BDD8|nr:tripartite tricarboxylate transporter substrate binding protein [Rhodoplanes sp.]NVO13985.1 tripartite tricarboxylate transporter substrate binding protein [Rhodoplanes sp.]
MSGTSRRSFTLGLTAASAATIVGGRAAAETFPSRAVRIIVPFTAGGASDTLARIIAGPLQDAFGQPVIVESRPGGNSSIGMLATATALPDGYTLVVGHIGTHAITPAISPPSGYDIATTFTTVAVHATSSNLLVVRSDSGIATLADLIARAKAKPDALNYGSPGVGSPSHIAVVQLASMTGIKVTHIAYRGNSAAVTDMLGGTLDFMFASPAEILEHVRSGKLKAVAASGQTRSVATPDVAPVAEQGVPGFDFRTWHVLSMRTETPPDVAAKIRGAVAAILASDAYRKRLADLSLDPGIADGLEADRFVRAEIARWKSFVKEAAIRPE